MNLLNTYLILYPNVSQKKHENLKIYGKQKYTCLNYKEVLCFYFLLLKQKKKIAKERWKGMVT